MLEAKPYSDARKILLAEELGTVYPATNPDLVSAATSLLAFRALPQGENHIQVEQGTWIAQADGGSTATVPSSRRL
jgi:hypothetical protein